MQLEEQLAIYEVFARVTPAWRPYGTEKVLEGNLSILLAWIANNMPRGMGAAVEIGSYELAFRASRDELERDPNYVEPISATERQDVFKRLYESLTAEQVKSIYRGVDLIRPLTDEQAEQFSAIGGVTAFKNLVDAM